MIALPPSLRGRDAAANSRYGRRLSGAVPVRFSGGRLACHG